MITHIKTHFNSLPAIITAIFVGLFVSWLTVYAAWSNPTANPTEGNVAAPLDTSAASQTKSGALTLGGVFSAPSAAISGAASVGGALTAGSLSVSGASSLAQTITAGNLSLNASNAYANALLIPYGKVGIGIAAPPANSATLQVKGTTRILGVPVLNLNFNTSYTATSDGFVMAYIYADNDGDRCELNGVSGTNDSGGNPRFAQAQASASYTTNGTPNIYLKYANIFIPVWKGYVWYVGFSSQAGTCQAFLRFIPLGQTNNA